jgi:UDP-N-acetyl-D-glucosamine/UDP-N-acetyl-D-galactosamine dehydrogenase
MNRKIAVIGLGYVGLPVAVAFGKNHDVVGFDIKASRIEELAAGNDLTGEIADTELRDARITFTTDAQILKGCDFFIIAVPTPIDKANKPDLSPLLSASRFVGQVLKTNDIVVFESTVYPGATEEDCVPALEEASGLKHGIDFFTGYSPERINPGDREHTFTNVKKIVAGCDATTLEIVAQVYSSVVTSGVHKVSSIKVAEAAKVIENTQRDLNIALMNELAVLFKRMNIDTQEVLNAAGTKWNFLPFRPGLVGGHCIGVDPYYLTYKAEQLGYIPQVILAGRRINDNMGRFVARETIKRMVKEGIDVARARVGVMGVTFKENCTDIRNSKVFDIIAELQDYGIEVIATDPIADAQEVYEEYGVNLVALSSDHSCDSLIVAVAHKQYEHMSAKTLRSLTHGNRPVLTDVKSLYPVTHLNAVGFSAWRL